MKRTPSQTSLKQFFKKPKQENAEAEVTECSSSNSNEPSVDRPQIKPIDHCNPASNAIWQEDNFHIGDLKKDNLNDELKRKILKSVLLPKQPYVYPMSAGKKQKRSFQENWIKDPVIGFPFLAYSKKDDAVYCKPCVLFFHEGVGKGGHQNPGKFVSNGFRDWKKARESFAKHSLTDYHKSCVSSAEQFMLVMSGKQKDIQCQLDSQHAREKEENRSAIRPIVETILFCCEQELPLRGDQYSGPLTLNKPPKKDGKFRALLRFRANSGDENLRRHFTNCGKNATYISPEIQNEIIQTCSDLVTEEIVNRINKGNCFTLLADETMDVSGTEQLSLCIRYVDKKYSTLIIREDFLGFIPIYDQTSENLTKVILTMCEKLGIDMSKCVGQGYDGAANMAGHLAGVQSRIRKQFPNARYVHCASHRLNLALSNTMTNPTVRNCLGVVSEVTNLFRNNSRANKILQRNISVQFPESKKRRLLKLCEKRFVERHDSLLTFVELFKCIVVSLEEISENASTISPTVSSLLAALEKSEFLISLFVCNKLFSITLPLSISLQEKSLDLASALNHTKNVLTTLQQLRSNAEKAFKEIFDSASQLSTEVFDSQLKAPRVTSRQTQRANPSTSSIEEYFRVAIFIPCIDTLILNLTSRFISNEDIMPSFQVLLPGFASPENINALEKLSPYFDDKASLESVKAEYILWCNKLSSIPLETEVLKVLESCDQTYYRTIHYLLMALATLPVTTCSVERSFSTMKRVKSVTRNLMRDDRLSALAILSIHWDLAPQPDKIIDVMARKEIRRLLL